MDDNRNGFQAAGRAVLTARQDMDHAAEDATGVAMDAVGLIALGLAVAECDATPTDPVTRDLAPARLWHKDPARRRERAQLLRELAHILDGDVPPTAHDLASCLPDGMGDGLALAALEDRARSRVSCVDASPSQLAHMLIGPQRDGRLVQCVRFLKREALRLFSLESQPRDKGPDART